MSEFVRGVTFADVLIWSGMAMFVGPFVYAVLACFFHRNEEDLPPDPVAQEWAQYPEEIR